jgi:hypothetical protein
VAEDVIAGLCGDKPEPAMVYPLFNDAVHNSHHNNGNAHVRQALMMELKSAGEDLPELRQIARRVIDCALNDEENWSWVVKEIWDRLDGKPYQAVEASIDDKRSALDWTTAELVAFLNERRADRDGAPEAGSSDRDDHRA